MNEGTPTTSGASAGGSHDPRETPTAVISRDDTDAPHSEDDRETEWAGRRLDRYLVLEHIGRGSFEVDEVEGEPAIPVTGRGELHSLQEFPEDLLAGL